MGRARRTPRATVVLCHPHPQYGGTMRSIVISALFEALPGQGIACLRFNFRGVEGSEGALRRGPRRAARRRRRARRGSRPPAPTGPLVLVGWSFGADMALARRRPAHRGLGRYRAAAALPCRGRLRRGRRTTRGRSCSCSPRTTSSARPARSKRRRASWTQHARRGGRGREPLLRGPHRSGRRRSIGRLRRLDRSPPVSGQTR